MRRIYDEYGLITLKTIIKVIPRACRLLFESDRLEHHAQFSPVKQPRSGVYRFQTHENNVIKANTKRNMRALDKSKILNR